MVNNLFLRPINSCSLITYKFTYIIVVVVVVVPELWPILDQISLPWQPVLVVVEFVWRHSVARPRKPLGRKDLRVISYISQVIDDFVSNFVAITTGLVVVEVFWHPSIAQPRKPPVGRKDLLNISYTSRVMADFVSNFVSMATWVGPLKICLTPLDSLILKTPG